MVKGNPYISVKSATTKALKAPKERQSVFVFGLVKLKAKIMNIAELLQQEPTNRMMTSPYQCSRSS